MDNIVCIYKITNTITGDFYIGQTHDFEYRMKGHKKKPAPKMREDVEKYGWDAFKFEIIEECTADNLTERENYYIQTLNPVYNTLPWGNDMPEEVCQKISQGLMGHPTSPETREKIRQAKLGQNHTTESCEKMSEKRLGVTLSDEHKEKCRQASLGNKSRSKAVICVETGKVYPNMKTAAADIGIVPSAISGVIRGVNITAGGYHWRYADEDANTGSRKRNVAVFCEDTGEYFPTIEAAAKKFGISASTVSRIARGQHKSSLHFKLVEEPTCNEIRTKDKRFGSNLSRTIIVCDETGEEFFGVKLAEIKLGIPAQDILNVLEGNVETAGGFHFRYTGKKLNQDVKVKIRCIETNEVYDNINEAAASVNLSPRTLANHLRGYKKSAGGCHWKYIETDINEN